MRFYLDDDVESHRILVAARRLGVDVTSSAECGNRGKPDDLQLGAAAEMGRAVVTRNYPDFDRLTREAATAGRPHSGVLLVPSSLPNDAFGPIARALNAYAARYPDGMAPYMVDYLRPVN